VDLSAQIHQGVGLETADLPKIVRQKPRVVKQGANLLLNAKFLGPSTAAEWREVAQKSVSLLKGMSSEIRWLHS
jgi:hypothetical protein